MTSSITSTTFTCLTCEQPVQPANAHTCTVRPPHLPRTVTDAIYNCKVCNPTDFTFYKCSCDMGTPRRTVTVIPPLNLPLAPIPEEDTDDFTAVFKFDDDSRPNSPELDTNLYQQKSATSLYQSRTLAPLLAINPDDDGSHSPRPRRRGGFAPILDINPDDLPADLVSRCQAIDKIFRDAEKK